MSHSTAPERHPEAYDGSMRELNMREVDRQWNQWIAESKVVQQRKRRRLIRGRTFRLTPQGRGGHIASPMVARLVAIDDAINRRRAITREAVTIELAGHRTPLSYDQWAQMLEDEENAAAIRAQADAGEESQVANEWERSAA